MVLCLGAVIIWAYYSEWVEPGHDPLPKPFLVVVAGASIIFSLGFAYTFGRLFWQEYRSYRRGPSSIFATDTGLAFISKKQKTCWQYISFEKVLTLVSCSSSFSQKGKRTLYIAFFEESREKRLKQTIDVDSLQSKKQFRALRTYIVEKVVEINTGREDRVLTTCSVQELLGDELEAIKQNINRQVTRREHDPDVAMLLLDFRIRNALNLAIDQKLKDAEKEGKRAVVIVLDS